MASNEDEKPTRRFTPRTLPPIAARKSKYSNARSMRHVSMVSKPKSSVEKSQRGTFLSKNQESEAAVVDKSSILLSEALKFLKLRDTQRAVTYVQKALEEGPEDGGRRAKLLLARCYLIQSKFRRALSVADEVLGQHEDHPQAIEMKAEILYHSGDFEQSLRLFERGLQFRPHRAQLSAGVLKCKKALLNGMGSNRAAPLRLRTPATLKESTFFNDEDNVRIPDLEQRQETEVQLETTRRENYLKSQLLGDFYVDYKFLKDLIKRNTVTNPKEKSGAEVKQMAEDCLRYLETRADFWNRQDPLHNRPLQNDGRQDRGRHSDFPDDDDFCRSAIQELDAAFLDRKFEAVSEKAESMISRVRKVKRSQMEPEDRDRNLAVFYCYAGSAAFQLGFLEKARDMFLMDQLLGEKHGILESEVRSSDNLASLLTQLGEPDRAVDLLLRALDSVNDARERAVLYTDLSMNHLLMKQPVQGIHFAEKARAAAIEAQDDLLQANAVFLMGEGLIMSQKLGDAKQSLEEARGLFTYFEGPEIEVKKSKIEEYLESIGPQIGTVNEKTESSENASGRRDSQMPRVPEAVVVSGTREWVSLVDISPKRRLEMRDADQLNSEARARREESALKEEEEKLNLPPAEEEPLNAMEEGSCSSLEVPEPQKPKRIEPKLGMKKTAAGFKWVLTWKSMSTMKKSNTNSVANTPSQDPAPSNATSAADSRKHSSFQQSDVRDEETIRTVCSETLLPSFSSSSSASLQNPLAAAASDGKVSQASLSRSSLYSQKNVPQDSVATSTQSSYQELEVLGGKPAPLDGDIPEELPEETFRAPENDNIGKDELPESDDGDAGSQHHMLEITGQISEVDAHFKSASSGSRNESKSSSERVSETDIEMKVSVQTGRKPTSLEVPSEHSDQGAAGMNAEHVQTAETEFETGENIKTTEVGAREIIRTRDSWQTPCESSSEVSEESLRLKDAVPLSAVSPRPIFDRQSHDETVSVPPESQSVQSVLESAIIHEASTDHDSSQQLHRDSQEYGRAMAATSSVVYQPQGQGGNLHEGEPTRRDTTSTRRVSIGLDLPDAQRTKAPKTNAEAHVPTPFAQQIPIHERSGEMTGDSQLTPLTDKTTDLSSVPGKPGSAKDGRDTVRSSSNVPSESGDTATAGGTIDPTGIDKSLLVSTDLKLDLTDLTPASLDTSSWTDDPTHSQEDPPRNPEDVTLSPRDVTHSQGDSDVEPLSYEQYVSYSEEEEYSSRGPSP